MKYRGGLCKVVSPAGSLVCYSGAQSNRRVGSNLKPNSRAEFTQKLESEIIPLLRKQKGFQDEITFVAPVGNGAFGVSLWDTKENAETYNRGSYAEVTKILSKLVDGTPQVETYEVSNSTFHKVAAAARA